MAGILEYLSDVQDKNDVESIKSSLHEVLSSVGFDHFAYLVTRYPAGTVLPRYLTNYPDTWVDHYTVKKYRQVDLTLQAAVNTVLPLRWDILIAQECATSRQRAIYDEARDFGIRHGATVPLHGPNGALAALSVAGDMSERTFDQLWCRERANLSLIASSTHEAIVRWAQDDPTCAKITLTERERECLSWTAEGKTTWEISQILSISQDTVRFHLRNAMQKFGVYSKHHAVVMAIMRGLIMP